MMKKYFENLCPNKLENLEETHTFLDVFDLGKLIQEAINLLHKCLSNEIDTLIKNLPTKKSPVCNRFTPKFYQTVKEELMPILLLKHFYEKDRESILSNSIKLATLILKLEKDMTKKILIGQSL
jgi:hypothetical protein